MKIFLLITLSLLFIYRLENIYKILNEKKRVKDLNKKLNDLEEERKFVSKKTFAIGVWIGYSLMFIFNMILCALYIIAARYIGTIFILCFATIEIFNVFICLLIIYTKYIQLIETKIDTESLKFSRWFDIISILINTLYIFTCIIFIIFK